MDDRLTTAQLEAAYNYVLGKEFQGLLRLFSTQQNLRGVVCDEMRSAVTGGFHFAQKQPDLDMYFPYDQKDLQERLLNAKAVIGRYMSEKSGGGKHAYSPLVEKCFKKIKDGILGSLDNAHEVSSEDMPDGPDEILSVDQFQRVVNMLLSDGFMRDFFKAKFGEDYAFAPKFVEDDAIPGIRREVLGSRTKSVSKPPVNFPKTLLELEKRLDDVSQGLLEMYNKEYSAALHDELVKRLDELKGEVMVAVRLETPVVEFKNAGVFLSPGHDGQNPDPA